MELSLLLYSRTAGNGARPSLLRSLVADTIQAGKSALKVEATRLKRRATLQAALIYILALGLVFAMAGVGVLLMPVIGLGWSLLVVAGFLIIVGAIGGAILASRS